MSWDRISGPFSRSRGVSASSFARRAASDSRSHSSHALRSFTGRGTRRDGATICAGSPSTILNVVRNTSCLETISFRLFSSACTSSFPRNRIEHGMLYAVLPGSSWFSNQKRCCAKLIGKAQFFSKVMFSPSRASGASFSIVDCIFQNTFARESRRAAG